MDEQKVLKETKPVYLVSNDPDAQSVANEDGWSYEIPKMTKETPYLFAANYVTFTDGSSTIVDSVLLATYEVGESDKTSVTWKIGYFCGCVLVLCGTAAVAALTARFIFWLFSL